MKVAFETCEDLLATMQTLGRKPAEGVVYYTIRRQATTDDAIVHDVELVVTTLSEGEDGALLYESHERTGFDDSEKEDFDSGSRAAANIVSGILSDYPQYKLVRGKLEFL